MSRILTLRHNWVPPAKPVRYNEPELVERAGRRAPISQENPERGSTFVFLRLGQDAGAGGFHFGADLGDAGADELAVFLFGGH